MGGIMQLVLSWVLSLAVAAMLPPNTAHPKRVGVTPSGSYGLQERRTARLARLLRRG